MENFITKIILNRLNDSIVETLPDGRHRISIIAESNDIFISDRGNAILGLSHWVNRSGPDQRGNTHVVKLSTSRDFAAKNPKLIVELGGSKAIIPKNNQSRQNIEPYGNGVPFQ